VQNVAHIHTAKERSAPAISLVRGAGQDAEAAEAAARALWSDVPHTTIGGLKVTTLSREDQIGLMLAEAPKIREGKGRARLVFDSNGHALSLRARDAAFRGAVDQADIVHADGGVIVAASRIFSDSPIPNRAATTDVYQDSLDPAAKLGVTYYLLGGKQDVVSACARKSRERAPGLQIVGERNGYFSVEEEDAIVAEINAAAPDVLWVGLGKPKEQDFCIRNRERLNVGWIVTCGGLYNYISGDYSRAPQWMQRFGLEWVHRMATNPRQLFWRYVTTNPHALWLIAARGLVSRFGPATAPAHS